MRTLSLTSPGTRGNDVRRAQQHLRKNAFATDFLQSKIDGAFGEATGRACRRAKFWLGYPTGLQTPVYGDQLAKMLARGPKELPLAYRRRRAQRLKAHAKKARPAATLGAKAFGALHRHVGLTEKPAGSNRCLFSAWYGSVGPWCAMGVTWAYVQAGSKAFRRGVNYAYVPYLVADARAGRNHLSVTKTPQHGDPVAFDWEGNGVFDHVGLFDHWTNQARGQFATLEGNTSADDKGSQSNGGGCFERERSTKAGYTVVFIHVGA